MDRPLDREQQASGADEEAGTEGWARQGRADAVRVRDRETGQVREHVQVSVGVESIRYTGGLATAVPDGSENSIVPAVSGG